jgi:hypothetical protein
MIALLKFVQTTALITVYVIKQQIHVNVNQDGLKMIAQKALAIKTAIMLGIVIKEYASVKTAIQVLRVNILHVLINALTMVSVLKACVIVNQDMKELIALLKPALIIALATVTVKIKNAFVNLVGKDQTVL